MAHARPMTYFPGDSYGHGDHPIPMKSLNQFPPLYEVDQSSRRPFILNFSYHALGYQHSS